MNNDSDAEMLPKLFKLTNTGAIQYWQIGFWRDDATGFGHVRTTYGQEGTDSPQVADDIIKKGKNTGRANATDPYGQARAEAEAKWDKKKKTGYTQDVTQAKTGDKGLPGIDPMLAHTWSKEDKLTSAAKQMPFPCLGQPKFDGLRSVAVVMDGKAKFYSRTRKPFHTVPHLVHQIETLCRLVDVKDAIFDGELYSHDFKENFNEIVSRIKRDEVHEDIKSIEYHIYDFPSMAREFRYRSKQLQVWLSLSGVVDNCKNLIRVETLNVQSKEDIPAAFERFLDMGYEGMMLRDPDSMYEGKRSKGLLKYKVFQDAEFEIVGVQEGRGKLMGHAGSFVCVTPEGKTFNAKLKGELGALKEYFVNFEEQYKGAILTVQYFRLTPDGVPRFPVGLRIHPGF